MCDGIVSADAQLNDGTCLGGFISGREIPFPGKQRLWLQRAVRLSRLMRVEAEHLVLPRPFGWQIAKAISPRVANSPELARSCATALSLQTCTSRQARVSAPLSLAAKSRFPGNRDSGCGERFDYGAQ